MTIDYHNHLLPKIDDGAQSLEESQGILSKLHEQGFRRVVTTPHYHNHREPVETFLARRDAALRQTLETSPPLTLTPGAEVRLERGLCEEESLTKLTMGSTRIILLELPFSSFHRWMPEEIYNIAYNHHLTPLMAHIDRYFSWYSAKEMGEILSIEDAVFQINYESLADRKCLKFILSLIQNGYPVVFGTDSHNLGERAPNGDLIHKHLKKRLTDTAWAGLVRLNAELIEAE